MSLSRRSIRRIVLSARPCSSVRSQSQHNLYSQLEQTPFKITSMLLDEIESENGIHVFDTNSTHSSISSAYTKSKDRTWLSRNLHSAGKQSYHLTTDDPCLLDRMRTTVHARNIFNPFKPRISADDIVRREEENNTQQPQLICEERRDNAIFKVYFKRIPQKSATLQHDSSHNNTTRGELLYSTIKIYQLKAGTMEKIIECLTDKHGELDSTHMQILFATYRTYTNTQTLIESILTRYQLVFPASLEMTEDIRRITLNNLANALIFLLNNYKEDFYEPPAYPTLNYLLKYAIDRDVQNQCRSLLKRFLTEGENTFKIDSSPSGSISEVDNNNNPKNYFESPLEYDPRLTISDLEHTILAQQLTLIDAELLKRVRVHECLTMGGNGNNRRGISSHRSLSTVEKTIEQFNAVVKRVIATVLDEINDQIRARVIEKWIDIADECRQLKNFSSLTAILNGLLSGCIYRLKTAWSFVNSQHNAILNCLKDVFGSCADRQQARAILDRQLDEIRLTLPECNEGTIKYLDPTISLNGTLGRKVRSKKTRDQQKIIIGTIPYLGLYLSDLTYLDSAHENYLNINETDRSSQKLIHFDKHRKQFEILSQIKLFQSAAHAYTTLHRREDIQIWFDCIPIYEEEDSWNRSFQIEPKDQFDNPQPKLHEDLSPSHRKKPLKAFPSQVSLESLAINIQPTSSVPVLTVGSLRSTPSLTSLDKLSIASIPSLNPRQKSNNVKEKKRTHSNHSRSSSASSFLTNASSSQGYMSAQASPANSIANCTVPSNDTDTLIAKVQLVGRNDLLYKKVRIGNNERTPSVLKIILDKFGLDPSTYERYCIEQKLPHKKIVLLDHCNVFYALVRQSDDEQIELIVREKTAQERSQTKPPFPPSLGHNRTPSGYSISSTHSR